MDKIIQGIQELLRSGNYGFITDLLEDARHKIIESSTYGASTALDTR